MKPGDMVLYESAKLLHGRPGKEAHCVLCVLYASGEVERVVYCRFVLSLLLWPVLAFSDVF